MKICSQCNGSGEGYTEGSRCSCCGGTGEKPQHAYDVEEEDLQNDD